MRYFVFAALLASALPAQSETKMTVAQFEEFTKSSTVFFNRHGAPYGAEQYLANNRVIWSFLDGTCQRGTWFGERDEICFIYEGQSQPLCWNFFVDGARKTARVIGDDPADELVVTGQNTTALSCPGPEIGVRYLLD